MTLMESQKDISARNCACSVEKSRDTVRVTKPRQQEGSREAHILPFDSEVNIERLDSLESSSSDSKSRLATKSEASGKSTSKDISSASGGGRSPPLL
jgi:hypothetical protein